MTVSKFPRIGRTRVDLEEAGWRWLRDGKPAALAFIGWLDIQGRRIGSAEQVWRVYGEALLAQVGPDGCAHALKVFGKLFWAFRLSRHSRPSDSPATLRTRL